MNNNPVKEEFVYLPEEYKYSSAIDYAGGKGILDIDVIKKICMNKYRITYRFTACKARNPNNNILWDCKSRMTELMEKQ